LCSVETFGIVPLYKNVRTYYIRAVSILRNRSLAALIAAEIVSSLGSRITFLALPWFVLVTTGSAAKMGIVLAVEMAPVALLGIPSGAVVARLGARRTMQLSDLARAPLMCSIPLLHSAGMLSFPLLLAIVFAIGCFLAPFFASQRVILPELVGEDETTVAQANAVIEGATTLTNLLGPVVAGLLIAAVGATSVLYIDAATFLFSFLTLTLFVPSRPPQPQTDDARGLFAGLRFLFRDPLLWRIGLAAVFLNMFGSALSAALPVLAFDEFGESSRVAGALFASLGAGALLGMVVAMKLMPRFKPLKLAAVGIVALSLPIWLLGLELPLWATMAALFASTISQPLVNAPVIGVMTTRTPEALRPKVMTAVLTIAMLAGPIGLVAAGPLLEAFGTSTVFVIIAAGMTVFALYFASVALRFGPRDVTEAPAVPA
jgi:MFS family permease